MENEMIQFEGLEDALIGQASVWDGNERVERLIYSGDKIVDILVERDGMTDEEAFEFIDFNIEGLYAGKGTPVVMWERDCDSE